MLKNLAKLDQTEMDKVNVDLAAAGGDPHAPCPLCFDLKTCTGFLAGATGRKHEQGGQG